MKCYLSVELLKKDGVIIDEVGLGEYSSIKVAKLKVKYFKHSKDFVNTWSQHPDYLLFKVYTTKEDGNEIIETICYTKKVKSLN